jgi:HTH-type transcriptional regulator / antitoxin HigA
MDIMPIGTKTNCPAALKAVECLMTAKVNTPEGDRLDVLTTLIEAHERTHFPMNLPDAVEAIEFRMEQSGLTVKTWSR